MFKNTFVALALLLGASTLSAQTLNCAALQNSTEAEPAGYAEQCGPFNTASAVIGTPSAVTDIAQTYDMRGDGAAVPPRAAGTLYNFIINNFAAQTTVGLPGTSIFAMDYNAAGTVLYAIPGAAAAANAGMLGTINTTTGAFTPIIAVTGLPAGASANGLTINPRTGAAFVTAINATPASEIYSLNLTTGVATLIGLTNTALMIDIAMNCAGAMYGHDIGTDSLYSISTTTGAATLIGGHGLAANFAQGMDFDNQDGSLYGFVYTGGGTNTFGRFNLTTGAITPLSVNAPLGEFEGAIPTLCFNESPTAVPTSTPWGLMLFGLLLLSLGFVAIRR